MPTISLQGVSLGPFTVKRGRKNAGGAFARLPLTCRLDAPMRDLLGLDPSWPNNTVEKAGALHGAFDCTRLDLSGDQQNTLGDITNIAIDVSLADGFKWSMEEPEDSGNRTILVTFNVRTSNADSAGHITAFVFSASSVSCTGQLSYQIPGAGSGPAAVVDSRQRNFDDDPDDDPEDENDEADDEDDTYDSPAPTKARKRVPKKASKRK